mgnify:CR=1 FL=1
MSELNGWTIALWHNLVLLTRLKDPAMRLTKRD